MSRGLNVELLNFGLISQSTNKSIWNIISWAKQSKPWMNINIDSYYCKDSNSSSIGGVFKNDDGLCFLQFFVTYSAFSPLHVESIALYTTIKIATSYMQSELHHLH